MEKLSITLPTDEREARIAAIRARVQASLDDPRPRLSSEQMREALQALFSKYR